MADVVAIHGIFMNHSSRREMEAKWHDAIICGLHTARFPDPDALTLECAFYGHLYNDGKSVGDRPYQAADLEAGLEQDLFVAIADAAGAEDEEIHREGESKLWMPDPIQRAVRRVERYRVLDGVSSKVISLVKQVGRYFKDDDFAEAVREELSQAMSGKPRVLVAHSLGSIIAYDWLRRQEQAAVPALITIGSPLGFRGVRRALDPLMDTSPAAWPKVENWVIVKKLDGLYGGPVDDRLAHNTRRAAHSAVKYLENVHTSNALKAALG
jgi:pimeloyl-ACP methyl ester carboxylesterase